MGRKYNYNEWKSDSERPGFVEFDAGLNILLQAMERYRNFMDAKTNNDGSQMVDELTNFMLLVYPELDENEKATYKEDLLTIRAHEQANAKAKKTKTRNLGLKYMAEDYMMKYSTIAKSKGMLQRNVEVDDNIFM